MYKIWMKNKTIKVARGKKKKKSFGVKDFIWSIFAFGLTIYQGYGFKIDSHVLAFFSI